MTLLIYGGRNYDNRRFAFAALDAAHAKRPITKVIEGGATGADRLGHDWARARGIAVETFNADWERHGNRAGPIRNQRMIDEGKPDGAVEFPGGNGTADMRGRLERAGVKIWRPHHLNRR